MADNRFFPWFKLEFEKKEQATDLAAIASKIKSVVPIDRNFYEADVRVEMHYALLANTFNITIAGLSLTLYDYIEANKTTVKIWLGYYMGNQQTEVFEGIVQKKEIKAGDCFYEQTLSGVERDWYLLDNTPVKEGDKDIPYADNTFISKFLDGIEKKTGIKIDKGGTPDPQLKISRHLSFQRQSALDALQELHNRLHQIDGYSLFVRDGKIRYALAAFPNNNTGQEILAQYTYDNYLVETTPINEDEGGRRGPLLTEKKDDAAVGYDFEMLGDPRLRPGDTVTFLVKVDKVDTPVTLTIESITHDFSRARGYRCKGRALRREKFLKNVFRAMAPSAEKAAAEINNMVARNQERYPAVHVADISEYTAGDHVANAKLGLQFEPTMGSPSIEVHLGAEGFTLQHRPMVSPFAWNNCGLVVPVYKGMRAVAVHNRYLREDALLSGFIWTEEMKPPPNQVGDYWLCLPLNVPSDRAPNTSDKAANDLTTGDGKRVIQLKGLRITIGEGLLESLGKRPDNVGSDNELQIEINQQTKITMKDGEIKLEAGGRTVDITNGKVSIT